MLKMVLGPQGWLSGFMERGNQGHVACSLHLQCPGGSFRPVMRSVGSQKVCPGMPFARCPSTVTRAALASSPDSSPCEKGVWTVDQPFPEPRVEWSFRGRWCSL